MTKLVLQDASIVVAGVDLSDHASKVTIDTKRNQVDVTSFGASNTEYALGLGDASIAVDFFQDYAASSVDQTLWPIYTSGTVVSVTVKQSSGVASSTNPAYIMTAMLPAYTPLDGQVGAASTLSVTFINANSVGITRSTTGLPPVLDGGAPSGSPITLDSGSPSSTSAGTIDGGSP